MTFFWMAKHDNANIWNMFNCVIDPACQNISTELQCYVMDPHCIAQSNTEKSSGPNDVIYTVSILGSLILFVICCITIILYYKQKRHSRNKSKLYNLHDLFYL